MYKLPDNIDQSKVFLINRSELEGRIDPNQYHIERKEAIAKLKKNNQLLKLKDVVKNVKTTTTQVSENDIYIGLENITSNTGEYIETKDKLSISSAGIFKEGQILFPKLRPYLNKVYLAEFDGICSTEFHIFKSDTFLNEFITIYLRSDLIVNQTKHLMTGNTLPRLQTDDINNLPVPNISIERQQQIVDLYNIASIQKRQKEKQAKKILKSIEAYLLNELNIKLPEKDNSLKSRIFMSTLNEISFNRFDPDYYKLSYKEIQKSISISKYKSEYLKNITDVLASGKTPSSSDYSEMESLFPIIKVGSYSGDYIDLTKTDFSINKQRLIAKKGDIYILSAAHQSEYVGKHIKYLQETPKIETSYVGELICVRASERVNSIYLFSLLNLHFYKTLINREKTGQTSHVYSRDLKNILIPLPPIEKQDEIAINIQNIRDEAKRLQEEAKNILDEAKLQVQKMILG